MSEQKFWMVWNAKGSSPKHKHYTEQSATAEAERLAVQFPGNRFYVLEAVRGREVGGMQRIELGRLEDLPF